MTSSCFSPMPTICTMSVRMKLYSLVQLMNTRVVVNQRISLISLINNWSTFTRLIIVQAMLESTLMVSVYITHVVIILWINISLGNFPLEDHLSAINERLAEFNKMDVPYVNKKVTPWTSPRMHHGTCALDPCKFYFWAFKE